MAEPIRLQLRRTPAVWRCYPAVVMRARPVVTEVATPPEFEASVHGVQLRESRVVAYARMCGFRPDAPLPLTYPHVLAMPLHLRIFAMPEFPLRPMGLIHLTNVIETAGELRVGMTLDIEVSARNYQRTAAGLTFDMDTEIRNAGRVVWRESCGFLSRWPEPLQRSGARPPRPPKAPKDATALAELPVSLRTAWDYARVSNDFNPIHLSARAARFFGLRGAIVHGMWSLARSLAEQAPGVLSPVTRIDTQFLTPVQLPARVTIKQWTADGQVRRALCDVRTGRVHMYAWWVAA
jgi:acyl dehydratase